MSDLVDASNFTTKLIEEYVSKPPFSSKDVTLYSVIFSSIFAFILLFGVLTNFLVIGVFILRSEFRQYTNFFFINLSIADILVLLFCIPITITDLYSPDEWHYGRFYCQMYTFFEYCVTTVSSLTIISISIERYYAVTKPLEVKLLFNRRNSILLLGLIWVVAILISIPFLFVPEYYSHPDYSQCFLNLQPNHMIYVTCLYVILIFAPVIGLSFLYILIMIKLRKHYKMFQENCVPLNAVENPSVSLTNHDIAQNHLRIHYRTKCSTTPSTAPLDAKRMSEVSFVSYKRKRMSSASFHVESAPKENRRRSSIMRALSCHSSTKSASSTLAPSSSVKTRQASGVPSDDARSTKPFIEPHCRQTIPSVANDPHTFPARSVVTTAKTRLSVAATTTAKSVLNRKINHTIMISMVALAFFFCQLPLRIFLLWSYNSSANLPHIIDDVLNSLNRTNVTDGSVVAQVPAAVSINQDSIFWINLMANCSTIIYFLHCVSNPIIYNFVSIKFRKAFLSLSGLSKRDNKTNFVM